MESSVAISCKKRKHSFPTRIHTVYPLQLSNRIIDDLYALFRTITISLHYTTYKRHRVVTAWCLPSRSICVTRHNLCFLRLHRSLFFLLIRGSLSRSQNLTGYGSCGIALPLTPLQLMLSSLMGFITLCNVETGRSVGPVMIIRAAQSFRKGQRRPRTWLTSKLVSSDVERLRGLSIMVMSPTAPVEDMWCYHRAHWRFI